MGGQAAPAAERRRQVSADQLALSSVVHHLYCNLFKCHKRRADTEVRPYERYHADAFIASSALTDDLHLSASMCRHGPFFSANR